MALKVKRKKNPPERKTEATPTSPVTGGELSTEDKQQLRILELEDTLRRLCVAAKSVTSMTLSDPEAVISHLEIFGGWRLKIERERKILQSSLVDVRRESEIRGELLKASDSTIARLTSELKEAWAFVDSAQEKITSSSCNSCEEMQEKMRLYEESFLEAAREVERLEETCERQKKSLLLLSGKARKKEGI